MPVAHDSRRVDPRGLSGAAAPAPARLCATTLKPEMSELETELLVASVRRADASKPFLEIGTAAGGSLCNMLGAFVTGKQPRFVVVDPLRYFLDQQGTVRRNLALHGIDERGVEFRAMESARAFPAAARAGERFSFILIDGLHKLVPFTLDLRWARLLEVGGILCIHDCSARFPGVQWGAARFRRLRPEYEFLGQAGSLVALRKTKAPARREVDLRDWVCTFAAYYGMRLRRIRSNRKQRSETDE